MLSKGFCSQLSKSGNISIGFTLAIRAKHIKNVWGINHRCSKNYFDNDMRWLRKGRDIGITENVKYIEQMCEDCLDIIYNYQKYCIFFSKCMFLVNVWGEY